MEKEEEIKFTYKCALCGMDKFTSPSPHKCRGGFRKSGLKWTEVKTMKSAVIDPQVKDYTVKDYKLE